MDDKALEERLFSDPLVQLETATEIIADLIAVKMEAIHEEMEKESPNQDIVKSVTLEISNLVKEQQQCYQTSEQHGIFSKAFGEYAEELRSKNA